MCVCVCICLYKINNLHSFFEPFKDFCRTFYVEIMLYVVQLTLMHLKATLLEDQTEHFIPLC